MCPDGILKQKSMISVSHTDVIKVTQLQEEYVAELQCDMTNAMEELVLCQEAMEGMSTRPWQIMLKFLPIFLFLYSPIFHLFFFLFYLFCLSINPFFSNIVVATQMKKLEWYAHHNYKCNKK